IFPNVPLFKDPASHGKGIDDLLFHIAEDILPALADIHYRVVAKKRSLGIYIDCTFRFPVKKSKVKLAVFLFCNGKGMQVPGCGKRDHIDKGKLAQLLRSLQDVIQKLLQIHEIILVCTIRGGNMRLLPRIVLKLPSIMYSQPVYYIFAKVSPHG